VKPKPFQIAFGVSILCHVAAVVLAVMVGIVYRQALLKEEDSFPALTLVAAPADPEPAASPTPVVNEAVPPPVQPMPARLPEPEPMVAPSVEAATPPTPPTPSPPEPAVSAAQVQREAVIVPEPTAPAPIRGDSSSPIPGRDATTMVQARPNYLKNPKPTYPLSARRRHQEGLVELVVTVTPQGRAASVRLKRSSGFSSLDQAALQAVRDYEFEPARIGETPVESECEVPVEFRLTD